uniref:C2H2-type domain-containing protein n=1 Tax=Syphacia muris TaxID=451379 RepID=A0A0N5AMY9_9BILA
MGDAFDDDEDRLMIDDVVEQGSVNATSTTRKNNSSCAQEGVYNTDSKEEGEIDDEEDAGGSNNATGSASGTAVTNLGTTNSQQNANSGNWSAVQQSHGFETLLNGGSKMVFGVEQHGDRNRSGNGHVQSSSSHSLSSGSQIPTTSNVVTTFQNVPCTSQASISETADNSANSGKQGEASLMGSHFKRSQDGARQRNKVKKAKEEACEVPARQSRNESSSNDLEKLILESHQRSLFSTSNNLTSYVPGSRIPKKKKLTNDDGEKEVANDSYSSNVADQSSSSSSSSAPTTAGLVEVASKRRKLNTRDRSTCVSSRSIQTSDSDVDVKEGMSYCLDFTVIGKVSNHLIFVSHWNGRDLYGVLGDGKPPMEQMYMSKRQVPNSSGGENGTESGTNGSHDRNGGTPSKQRSSSKRSNRSSSVCPVNGFSEKSSKKGLSGGAGRPASASTSELQSIASENVQDEETSRSPVSWLSAGGSDPLYGIGVGSIGSSSGLTQLKEACTSGMLSCPVAGCGYRFDTQAQMTLHRRSHFDRSGQRAIYMETVATQTLESDFPHNNEEINNDKKKDVKAEVLDVPADAPPDLMPASQVPLNKPLLSQINISTQEEKPVVSSNPGENPSTNLTSTEQQSIKRMFEIVHRPMDASGAAVSPVVKKGLRAGPDFKTSKGFETSLVSVDQSCASSSALDAIQKMVSGGVAQASSVTSAVASSLGGSRQDNAARQNVLPGVAANNCTKGISNGSKKPGSPFSDLSDDAPILAPEVNRFFSPTNFLKVVDKTSEAPLVTVKVQSSPATSGLLSPLSLSVSGDKGAENSHGVTNAEGTSIGLLCTNASAVTTALTSSATVANSPAEVATNAPLPSAPTEISKKAETKQPSSISSVVNTFPPISPFPQLDGNAFSQALRPPLGMPVGASGLQVASTSAGLLPQQPYIMMPFAMPTISSTPAVPTGKHKIHDLKTTGISNASKDSSPLVRMSPSMIASPGARPPSVGPSGGQSIKTNQQHNVGAGASNQRPSSSAPFMMGQPVSATQPANERNAANLNYLQQQQQAMFFQQYMNQMRFSTAFPGMMTPPTSVSMAHQAAYEQFAAMQQLGEEINEMF